MKMASYLQGGGFHGASLRTQDHADQKGSANGGESRHGHSTKYLLDVQSNRTGLKPHPRGKRASRATARGLRYGPRIGVLVFLALCIVSITIIGGDYLFSLLRNHRGGQGSFRTHDFFENQDGSSLFSFWSHKGDPASSKKEWEYEADHDGDGKKKRPLQFGKAFVHKEELVDRDSRYWDKDDRVRKKYLDYDETGVGMANKDGHTWHQIEKGSLKVEDVQQQDDVATHNLDVTRRHESDDSHQASIIDSRQGGLELASSGNGGLYNERGRKELRIYEEQLEAGLREELDTSRAAEHRDGDGGEHVSSQAFFADANEWTQNDMKNDVNLLLEDDADYEYGDRTSNDTWNEGELDVSTGFRETEGSSHHAKLTGENWTDDSSEVSATSKALHAPVKKNQGTSRQQPTEKTKRRRRAGNPCDIDFLQTTDGLHEPKLDSRFETFSLKYVTMESSQGVVGWEPRFAGHQTLAQRNKSFIARDQVIHCGFVQGESAPQTTGFDLAEDDVHYLNSCKVAVSSCIFGSSDNVRSPRNRKLTGSFKKDVCFVMFVDQSTLEVMQQEGQEIDQKGFLGPWRIVLVRNMPYMDFRRVGKIPKFLTHRLFPTARYSIWLDSKLRLQNDPVLILEYFLWRGGHEYAISNHYDRHCVWEEVQQNKKLNKYNHTAIDEQFTIYQADGLTRFDGSDPKKLLPSNVPEGSFIIRAHTPMSNLFSCLWFNEVDRFTSRDQLSFAYTYMKFVRSNPDKRFHFNMFKDCERKSIAKLFRHRKSCSSGQCHA